MGTVRLGLKFGMELHRHKPRMILQLDNLDEIATWIESADHHSSALQLINVSIVPLVPVTMPLTNAARCIRLRRASPSRQPALITAEPHRRSFIDHFLLLLHHV